MPLASGFWRNLATKVSTACWFWRGILANDFRKSSDMAILGESAISMFLQAIQKRLGWRVLGCDMDRPAFCLEAGCIRLVIGQQHGDLQADPSQLCLRQYPAAFVDQFEADFWQRCSCMRQCKQPCLHIRAGQLQCRLPMTVECLFRLAQYRAGLETR